MSTHTARINGLDLVYDLEGSGPPLVFLHGMNASAVYWEAVVPHLLDHYSCYLLEQRGMGRSARAPDGEYSVGAFVDDCVSFLETVSGPAIIVGQSLGGFVAAAAAARRAELVRAIYSEDSVPHAYAADPLADTSAILGFFQDLKAIALKRDAHAWSVARFAHEIGRLTTFGPPLADVWSPATLVFFARNAYGCDPLCYDATDNLTADEIDGLCKAIRCPFHIAAGNERRGAIVSDQSLERMRHLNVEFSVSRFEAAGHMVSHSQPRDFIDDLKAFLGRQPA